MDDDRIDDGSGHPLGYQTPDGELEVQLQPDGTSGFVETDLGRHMRWLRQAPDLYERYYALLTR